ncbi:MAG: formimidoylglutamate deiminase [Nannocystaceae bacterium]|nr:formimidoylglutamate deiminase [Nannocystaceae bacterium]
MNHASEVLCAAHGVVDGEWLDAPWLELDSAGTIVEHGSGHPPADRGPVRDLGPVVLLPGFVNAHSHAFQRAIRGATHRRDAGEQSSFWSWRQAMYGAANAMTPSQIYNVSRQAFREMLLAGITCVGEFHYLHHQPDGTQYDDPNELGRSVLAAAADVGIRIVLLDVFYARAGHRQAALPEQRRFCDHDVEAYLRRIDVLRSEGVAVGVTPHSIRAVDGEALRTLASYANANTLPIHTHLSEQPRENEECLHEHGTSPAQAFADAGCCARPRAFTAVHAVHIDDNDRRILANQHVCACPTTEADLGDGIVGAAQLLSDGARIALGSDSNAVIDLIQEARALEMHERLASQKRLRLVDDSGQLWPTLLRAATESGASALGISATAGRLAVGRPFDACTVALDDPSLDGLPSRNVLDAVFASGTARTIRHVFVGGRARV